MSRLVHTDRCETAKATAGLTAACWAVAIISSPAIAKPATSSGPGPHELTGNSDVTIRFDTLSKKAENDENRIDSLIWAPFAGLEYAAVEPATGVTACTDPIEFFGQAEGYPDTTQPPRMVIGGQRASYSSNENVRVGISTAKTYTGLAVCPAVSEDGLVRTIYTLDVSYHGAFKVERTFRFKSGLGVVQNSGLRAYIPRTPAQFHYVIVPNKEGKLVTYDAANCTSSPCAVTDWNGVWFAHYDNGGSGIIVIRDASSKAPAFIGIQSGGLSNANFSSIVLQQPAAGWSGLVTETEYVCFFGEGSWNPSTTLPYDCGTAANQ